ncbi:MAG: hypothetical protein HYV07_15595 [Deltaproteobacteria bacterium]|nr:hypothetical protein [Deltaproteobacteria bacterium]
MKTLEALSRYFGRRHPESYVDVRAFRSAPRLRNLAHEAAVATARALDSGRIEAATAAANLTSIAPRTFELDATLAHLSGDVIATYILVESATREVVGQGQVRVREKGSAELALGQVLAASARRVILAETVHGRRTHEARAYVA